MPRLAAFKSVSGIDCEMGQKPSRRGPGLDAARRRGNILCITKYSRPLAFGSGNMDKLLFVAALACGAGIAYVDSRPTWDDTGVTAAAVLAVSGLLGLASPRRAWLWALAVGAWVPAWGIANSGNYGSLLALAFAFAGAYAGAGVRKAMALAGNEAARQA